MKKEYIRKTVFAAVIAALYYVLTAVVFQPVSFLPVQFRVAEMMMLLPAIFPSSVWGLFAGCLFANFLNPGNLGLVDILGGSLTTLLAAEMTRRIAALMKPETEKMSFKSLKLWILPLPTVILNGLIVGSYLPFLLGLSTEITAILLSVLSVAAGEFAVCYMLGVPVLMAILKNPLIRRAEAQLSDRG